MKSGRDLRFSIESGEAAALYEGRPRLEEILRGLAAGRYPDLVDSIQIHDGARAEMPEWIARHDPVYATTGRRGPLARVPGDKMVYVQGQKDGKPTIEGWMQAGPDGAILNSAVLTVPEALDFDRDNLN